MSEINYIEHDDSICIKKFADINLSDPFFDPLRVDYDFDNWFKRKAKLNQDAFVQYSDGRIQAFLYLKTEEGEVDDIEPKLPMGKHLKVATFKIEAHHTKLGERFIKKIVDVAIVEKFEDIYVTVFPKHVSLINLLQKYGFELYGKKGNELVLVKKMNCLTGDINKDFPMMTTVGKRKFILSVYPKFHTRLFPDSILCNEEGNRYNLIRDVSSTNSIHKVYICFMPDTSILKKGDLLVIYRTNDGLGPARFRSVATSVCQVEEVRQKIDFSDVTEYLEYVKPYSIFSDEDLRSWYKMRNFFIIKMTYNIAFNKRVTRGVMLDEIGISPNVYWGFFQLTDDQFYQILNCAEINEGIIVD